MHGQLYSLNISFAIFLLFMFLFQVSPLGMSVQCVEMFAIQRIVTQANSHRQQRTFSLYETSF